MKNKVLVSITIIALFSASFCMFFPLVNAQGYALFNLDSTEISGGITIDGRFDAQESGNVVWELFTLYDFDNIAIQREIEVASVYNDTTLFLWITVDETETESGTLLLVFQTTNEPIVINGTIPSFSDGNDVKYLNSNNDTMDLVMSFSSGTSDSSSGGTFDFEGKCYSRSGGFDFEVAIPLNSGDVNGGDISLMEGDSINLFPSYHAELSTGTTTFSLMHSEDGWWEKILVELVETSIPSYSIPILLFSVLAVSMGLIFKYYYTNRSLKK